MMLTAILAENEKNDFRIIDIELLVSLLGRTDVV